MPKERRTIDERFKMFHQDNPRVYLELCRIARNLKRAGLRKVGIGMLWETLRYEYALNYSTRKYKLPNEFRSRYARYIMKHEEDLQGFFTTGKLRTA